MVNMFRGGKIPRHATERSMWASYYVEEVTDHIREQISEESYRRNQEIFAWINSSQERPELYTGRSRSSDTIQEALGNSGSKEV